MTSVKFFCTVSLRDHRRRGKLSSLQSLIKCVPTEEQVPKKSCRNGVQKQNSAGLIKIYCTQLATFSKPNTFNISFYDLFLFHLTLRVAVVVTAVLATESSKVRHCFAIVSTSIILARKRIANFKSVFFFKS